MSHGFPHGGKRQGIEVRKFRYSAECGFYIFILILLNIVIVFCCQNGVYILHIMSFFLVTNWERNNVCDTEEI